MCWMKSFQLLDYKVIRWKYVLEGNKKEALLKISVFNWSPIPCLCMLLPVVPRELRGKQWGKFNSILQKGWQISYFVTSLVHVNITSLFVRTRHSDKIGPIHPHYKNLRLKKGPSIQKCDMQSQAKFCLLKFIWRGSEVLIATINDIAQGMFFACKLNMLTFLRNMRCQEREMNLNFFWIVIYLSSLKNIYITKELL